MCHPTKLGSLGILHLEKFATTLKLRWLWLEWVDDKKAYIGLGNTFHKQDRDYFATATIVTVENGEKAIFDLFLALGNALYGHCAKNIQNIKKKELDN
jgi:hypothetical protein